ncbi:MAG: ClbS/DfsB family four-helix bundle protein [Anaerolineae bacterium]|nr:ClbS/DfsB family four-helix bundle protein [Anaerolineae bacterium]
MNKSDLQEHLQESHRNFETLLDQIGEARMEEAGVAGHWSMKDIIAHLTGWHQNVVARFRAALHGEPQPPTPWPSTLQHDDEINAWFYERNHERPLREVLADNRQLFQQLFAVVAELPADARIETVRLDDGREFYLPWIGDQRFTVCEIFDHFRDDHEPQIRAWLAQQ